jgi:hypothetical protein
MAVGTFPVTTTANLATGLILLAVQGWGQECLPYETPSTLTGWLVRVDEGGYNQFVALRLERPLCVTPEPEQIAGESPSLPEQEVTLIQLWAPPRGISRNDPAVEDRVSRLAGYRVTVDGKLWHAHTRNHRTRVLMDVQRIDPMDAHGQAALKAPRAVVRTKDVPDYEVLVKAGASLTMEARESKSSALLTPVEAYAPHSMLGEGVYINCRPGYRPSPRDGRSCDAQGCGVKLFPETPLTFRIRCTKFP